MHAKVARFAKNMIIGIVLLGLLYTLLLCFPQPFYKYSITEGNITLYSDEQIPADQGRAILKIVNSKISKSIVFKPRTKHRVFITNNNARWVFFTSIKNKVGGLNYVIFNHNIVLRKADILDNRLYGPSGNKVPGDRTLDYFISHEIGHTLEFESMPFYRYPINTNWVLEGYADYIAHDSDNYETSLSKYLNVPENQSAKYYTRARTMVAYLLEKEDVRISDLWDMKDKYDEVKGKAIPEDIPLIE